MIDNLEYLDRMKKMLGDSYPAFFESINSPRTYGLRFNKLKVNSENIEAVKDALSIDLNPIEWEPMGYYYDGEKQAPGKHVLHDIGAYYIQEPSAQSVVPKLMIEDGDIILDLCAAPGGKSSQILSYLNGTGLLISNEIVKDRSLILASNIERMGAKNSIVLNESPDRLSMHFPLYFDKILIDSPCSGEGMFRKNPEALNEWSAENVEICIKRDDDILNAAAVMLKMGGTLVYSTCTFEYGENEGAVERFLSTHEEFECIEMLRLYPHQIKGEGHFYAVLKKNGDLIHTQSSENIRSSKKDKINKIPELDLFAKETLNGIEFLPDDIVERGTNVIKLHTYKPDLNGLNVVRNGLCLGVLKKNRFEPSHTLAMTLKPEDVKNYIECSEEQIIKYLKGETINCDPSIKGWVLVCYKGISAGWGKSSNGTVKNHYPKGLRRY